MERVPESADRAAIAELAKGMSGLRLLVLHGSRARDDARKDSDWDFGYLADEGFDQTHSWRDSPTCFARTGSISEIWHAQAANSDTGWRATAS